MGKVSGKGASVIQYLIQLFYKRLDALGFDNKQVSNLLRNFTIMVLGSLLSTVLHVFSDYTELLFLSFQFEKLCFAL